MLDAKGAYSHRINQNELTELKLVVVPRAKGWTVTYCWEIYGAPRMVLLARARGYSVTQAEAEAEGNKRLAKMWGAFKPGRRRYPEPRRLVTE